MRTVYVKPTGLSLRVAQQAPVSVPGGTAVSALVGASVHVAQQQQARQAPSFLHSIGVFYQPHPAGPVPRPVPHQQQQQPISWRRSPRARPAQQGAAVDSGSAVPVAPAPAMLSSDDWKKRAHARNRTEVIQVTACTEGPMFESP
jgi:hypothetical protein